MFPNLVTSRLLQSLCQFLSCSSSHTLPGPPSLLFIGNIKELTHDHLPIHLTHLAQRYGKIYRLKCGNTSNDAWRHVKYRHFELVETPFWTSLLYLFSHGDTEQHRRHKRSSGEKMVRLCWETSFIYRYNVSFWQDLIFAGKLTFLITACCDSCQPALSLRGGELSHWGTTQRSGRHTVASSTAPCSIAASSPCMTWLRDRHFT